MHNGTCVNEEIENECDFKNWRCKYDEYNGETLYSLNGSNTYEKSWICKTPWVTQPKVCLLQWECEGNCVGNGNFCGAWMYQGISLNTKDRCEAAGAYWTNNSQNVYNNASPCNNSSYINLGGSYSDIPKCGDLRFEVPSCSNYPYCWYHSCFKFTGATKVCYTQVNGGTKNKYTGNDAVTNCGAQPTDPWCTNTDTYTLSFNKNGCSSTNQSTRYLDAWTSLSFLSTEATCSPNIFVGWNDKADCSWKTWKSSDKMPSNNLTLYACYQIWTQDCSDEIDIKSDTIYLKSCEEWEITIAKNDVSTETYFWAPINWGTPGWCYNTVRSNPSLYQLYQWHENIVGKCTGQFKVPSDEDWQDLSDIWSSIDSSLKNSFWWTIQNVLGLKSSWTDIYPGRVDECDSVESAWYWSERELNEWETWVNGRGNPVAWWYYWSSTSNDNTAQDIAVAQIYSSSISVIDLVDYKNNLYLRCFKK